MATIDDGMTQAYDASGIGQVNNPLPPKRRNLDDLEGELISESYQIIRRVGKGGMGVVYLAKQTKLGRDVCLKVLNPALLDNEDAVGRFQREARGLSILHHPNIVTIFDYGRDGDFNYIVMEYAQGITLSKYIKQNGKMSLGDFLPIAVQTLKGIGEAHKLGLIHRDIKPANIILCELEGEKNFVKILDFGLAKLAHGDDDVTKEHQLVGSASYMAPEQILTGVSDTRTDVYALGVMFYLMLAGKKPFTGPNDNVILYKHVNEAPAPLRSMLDESQGVPDTLCDVIDQCLSKDPNKRPETAIHLLNAISFALDAPQIRAGYSSMSLGQIDLQKLSDDAETHMIPTDNVSNAPAPNPPAPAPNLSASSLPVITELPANAEINGVNAPGELSLVRTKSGSLAIIAPQLEVHAQRDRRFLIIMSIVVTAVLICVVVLLITTMDKSPSTPQTPQIVEDKLTGLFSAIEHNIAEKKWQDADAFLTSAKARPEAQTQDAVARMLKYENQIEAGKTVEQANQELEKGNLDEARRLFAAALDKNPNNSDASAGLAQVDERINAQGALTFHYNGDRAQLKLFINDEAHGNVPESLRLPPGSYTLRVEKDGYKNWIHQVNLKSKDAIELDVELDKQAAKPQRKKQRNDDDDDLLLAPKSRRGGGGLLGI